MKMYHNGKRIRDNKGRFSIGKKKKRILIYSFIALSFAGVVYYGQISNENIRNSLNKEYQSQLKAKDTQEKVKIEELKWQVVDDLAQKCEIRGVPEGRKNSMTILDTNGMYSRGQWQFQSKTVQYYYKKFYNQNITVDQSVIIAQTQVKARQLAYDIIWKDVGGVYNWKTCAKRLGLVQRIEIIRRLTN